MMRSPPRIVVVNFGLPRQPARGGLRRAVLEAAVLGDLDPDQRGVMTSKRAAPSVTGAAAAGRREGER